MLWNPLTACSSCEESFGTRIQSTDVQSTCDLLKCINCEDYSSKRIICRTLLIYSILQRSKRILKGIQHYSVSFVTSFHLKLLPIVIISFRI